MRSAERYENLAVGDLLEGPADNDTSTTVVTLLLALSASRNTLPTPTANGVAVAMCSARELHGVRQEACTPRKLALPDRCEIELVSEEVKKSRVIRWPLDRHVPHHHSVESRRAKLVPIVLHNLCRAICAKE